MKILWLVNIVMPELAEHLGEKPSVFGGWLSGALEAIRSNGHELVVCTSRTGTDKTSRYSVNGVTYYLFPTGSVEEMEQSCRTILQDENPDVVHIYGTVIFI